MESQPIRFAIVGCGHIAQRHAEHISRLGVLKAVCDIDGEKAERLAKKYETAAYTSVEDMLASETELDVASICTPNGMHASHAVAAFRAGVHVLCEKPMALSIQDCSEMIREAEKANKRLFIVKQNRFNPPVAALKRVIDEGRLGKIYSVQLNCFWNRTSDYYRNSWKGTKSLDGGTLFTQFSHFIDLLYWLIGDVKEVSAYVGNYHHKGVIEFEDAGAVVLLFHSGAIGTINFTVNSHDTNMEGSLTIFGEKGTVKIGGQYLNELEYQSIEGYEIKDLPPGNPANNYGKYFGSMSNHDKVYQNVIDVLLKGDVIATNGFEGLKTVEIIDKIYSGAARVN